LGYSQSGDKSPHSKTAKPLLFHFITDTLATSTNPTPRNLDPRYNGRWAGELIMSCAQREQAMAQESEHNLDRKVCYCFHVSRRKLVNFVRLHRPRVASQLSECGGAGTGCGWCIPFLKQIFQQAVAGGQTELEQLTPEEYERRRADYIRAGKGTPPPGAAP